MVFLFNCTSYIDLPTLYIPIISLHILVVVDEISNVNYPSIYAEVDDVVGIIVKISPDGFMIGKEVRLWGRIKHWAAVETQD